MVKMNTRLIWVLLSMFRILDCRFAVLDDIDAAPPLLPNPPGIGLGESGKRGSDVRIFLATPPEEADIRLILRRRRNAKLVLLVHGRDAF